jgi:hypothetical protein
MNLQGTFRSLQKFYDGDLLIANDKYVTAGDESMGIIYSKKDFLFKNGEWRGENVAALFKRISQFRNPVVVSGHSDLSTNLSKIALLKGIGVDRFFGTNTLEKFGFSHALPTGLCDQADSTETHKILGDNSLLVSAHESSSFPTFFSPKIELNFTAANSPQRIKLLKELSQGKNIVVKSDAPRLSKKTRLEFLISCREKSFVICPPGNGQDTHRLWETLYMGGIPIMKENRYLAPLVSGLPVLTVKSWSHVLDTQFLERSWYQITSQSYSFDKLSIQYWLNLILQKRLS